VSERLKSRTKVLGVRGRKEALVDCFGESLVLERISLIGARSIRARIVAAVGEAGARELLDALHAPRPTVPRSSGACRSVPTASGWPNC
jgi:hypothetical protein